MTKMNLNKKIVPTLFALNLDVFCNKLENLNFCDELHIDFMDGTFTKDKTISFSQMSKIKNYKNIKFSAHLMTNNPLEYIDDLKKLNIKDVLFQFEIGDEKEVIKTIEEFKKNDFNVGIVLNPQTPITKIKNIINMISNIMFMSVIPGAEGQKFHIEVLDKIKEFRKENPNIEILIDGGISDKTISEVSMSGVNKFCVGSFVSSSENPRESFKKLNDVI